MTGSIIILRPCKAQGYRKQRAFKRSARRSPQYLASGKPPRPDSIAR